MYEICRVCGETAGAYVHDLSASAADVHPFEMAAAPMGAAARVRAALAGLADDVPLMQATETDTPWGGVEEGERESGATVGDLRELLRELDERRASALSAHALIVRSHTDAS